jgi:hypothetical protein
VGVRHFREIANTANNPANWRKATCARAIATLAFPSAAITGDLTANQIGRQRGRLSPALKVTETSSQTAEKWGQVTFRDETG